jgi:alkanesulfonate monooxygenase SsuD/methylene tetrahydromethanopterin reductase-like flavin-dependent oxidoreductase (luciferase family)
MDQAKGTIKLGLSVFPQGAAWESVASTAQHADALGYDSLWAWDHLLGIGRDGEQPVFEAWATVTSWATMTSHATVGLLVCANTFRNPGLVAKSAVTVDHISGGRFVLGLGAGYRELEHRVHGIDFGSGFTDRLAWLQESVDAIRALLSGETVTSPLGGHYRLAEAAQLPLPIRGPGTVPILIPGGGERKTLYVLARSGDMWHVRGDPPTLAKKLKILQRYCVEVGRKVEEIELTTGNPVVIRDEPAEAERVYNAMVQWNGQTRGGTRPERAAGEPVCGPPGAVAKAWRPLVDLGFRHFIVDFPAPYDQETLERLPEVRELLTS